MGHECWLRRWLETEAFFGKTQKVGHIIIRRKLSKLFTPQIMRTQLLLEVIWPCEGWLKCVDSTWVDLTSDDNDWKSQPSNQPVRSNLRTLELIISTIVENKVTKTVSTETIIGNIWSKKMIQLTLWELSPTCLFTQPLSSVTQEVEAVNGFQFDERNLSK